MKGVLVKRRDRAAMPSANRRVALEPDPLDDFEARRITLRGQTRTVHVSGEGPAVIVMSEIPGIYKLVADYARKLRAAGFTAWMPHLFGEDGRPPTPLYSLGSIARACISAEFRVLASRRSSPIVDWLRALAAHAHPLCGGRGVGAVGMCFTGNFALAMMLEPAMLAPVLSQPSLPFFPASGLHIAPEELAAVKRRLDEEELTVLGYRFEGDPFCRRQRFDAYEAALGDRFLRRDLPKSAAAKGMGMHPHSVLTLHLIDREGEPTRAAVDETLALFAERLREPD